MRLNELAKLLRSAGDESRLRILCVIFAYKKVCVSDIAEELGLGIAIVSHHLRVMARDGLVVSVRDGKRICYTLPKKAFTEDLKRFICKYK